MKSIVVACLAVLLPVSGASVSAVARAEPAVERADRLIDAGLAFLKSQQNADGSFVPDAAPPAINALALRAFVQDDDFDLSTDFVARGYDKLLSFQVADGGIYRDLLASYNTAIAISSLAAADSQRFAPQIERAKNYLISLQWTPATRPEFDGKNETSRGQQVVVDENDPFYGGWGYGGRSRGPGRPDLSNTHMAIEALRAAGVDANDPAIQRALAFVSRTQNYSETNPAAWAGNDGGFVYGPSHDRTGESMAGEYTGPDGRRMLRSYGSMTYAGLKSFIYAGLSKDDPRVEAAVDWISNHFTLDENPGMRFAGEENAKAGYYYYIHTLAKAMNLYDQPVIHTPGGPVDWRVVLIDKLAELQNEDGSWTGNRRWMEDNAILTTSYVVLALEEAQADLREFPANP